MQARGFRDNLLPLAPLGEIDDYVLVSTHPIFAHIRCELASWSFTKLS